MTTYVIFAGEEQAKSVSRVVSCLALAMEQREPHRVNDDAFLTILHGDGRAALVIPDGWTFFTTALLRGQMDDPTDAAGIKADMHTHLAPVLQGESDTLTLLFAAFRGATSINMADLLPYLKPSLVRTRDGMIADGWFS
jgi:hypothetical protein